MTESSRDRLPLEATPDRLESGWMIRLPVRAEQITISKQAFVRERVRVARDRVQTTVPVQAEIRREVLSSDNLARD